VQIIIHILALKIQKVCECEDSEDSALCPLYLEGSTNPRKSWLIQLNL